MIAIPVYAPDAEDFSSNGLGLMLATECTIEETRNGMYELKMVQPITSDMRWAQVQNGCILKAPAPVRESPLYEMSAGGGETTVTRAVYKVSTRGSRLRLRQKPSTSARILGSYAPGTEVVQLEDNGSGWYRVSVSKGGATGWMSANYLTFVRNIEETLSGTKPVSQRALKVQPARDQLFRVYSVENDTESGIQTATAMHIFYDLRGNLVGGEYSPSGAAAADAAQRIFDLAMDAHDFDAHIGGISGTVTGEYGYSGIAEALLSPDTGVIAQSDALLVRDNYDIFLLPDAIRDMGVTIRRGKNLQGVVVTADDSDVITRIIPRGKDKEGNPLYLSGDIHVDSPRIGDYPVVRGKLIDYDVQVSDADDAEFKTVSAARAELKRRAEAEFESGADLPTYGMEVSFVNLADTDAYADYSALQSVHMHDTVTVIDELIGLSAKLRVTGYSWNALTGQYNSITLGDIQALHQTAYGYSIADGTVSGSKLIPGSVDGGIALRDFTVQYAKIAIAAIQQLNAEAITAVTGRFGSISADEIETDELYAAVAHVVALAADSIRAGKIDADALAAALAEITVLRAGMITADTIDTDELAAAVARIVALRADTITAESIETDELGAALAKVIALYAQVGEFDFVASKNLVSGALSVEEASADSVYITNLAVTNANLLSATLGKLVLKGEDGKYYEIVVGADGQISTREVTVSEGEIAAGETAGGRQIVETSANIGDLNAQNIKGNQAIINTILTTALTAEKITAADAMIASATIPALYATSIQAIGNSLDLRANESVKLAAGDAVDALEIGGRNLYAGTRDFSGDAWNNLGLWAADGTADGFSVRTRSGAWNGLSQAVEGRAGDVFTLSCRMKAAEGADVRFVCRDADAAAVSDRNNAKIAVGTDWAAYSVTFSLNADAVFYARFENAKAVNLSVCALKLERGGKATDWTPAPEDAEGQIAAVRAELDVQKEQITAKVSREELDGVDERINGVYSEVTQRADGLEAQLIEKVDGETLRAYIRYDGENVEIGRSDSRYRTQTSDRGFVILQDGAEMTSMEQNAVTAPVFRARRTIEIGGHVMKLGSAGHLIIN